MVFGNLSTGYWLGAAAAAGLHWIELGRTTLGSSSDTISVTGLANKPYMMIIPYVYDTGSSQVYGQGTFNGDTGGNYSSRWSSNGGTDNTGTSETSMRTYFAGAAYGEFGLFNLMNVATQEKIMLGGGVAADATGVGTAPKRREIATKWANTTDAVSRFDYVNGGGGTFDTGSEVVVLGYDPDDTEGGSVWEELADVTLGSAGDTITTSTFTAKKYLMVQTHGIASGNLEAALQVGNGSIDTGSNYAVRWQVNGTEGSGTSKTSIDTNHTASGNEYINYFIVNAAAKEKLVIAELIDSNSAGAGNAPNRVEHTGKWTNTSNQINIVQAKNVGSGSFDTGSSIKVWGFD